MGEGMRVWLYTGGLVGVMYWHEVAVLDPHEYMTLPELDATCAVPSCL